MKKIVALAGIGIIALTGCSSQEPFFDTYEPTARGGQTQTHENTTNSSESDTEPTDTTHETNVNTETDSEPVDTITEERTDNTNLELPDVDWDEVGNDINGFLDSELDGLDSWFDEDLDSLFSDNVDTDSNDNIAYDRSAFPTWRDLDGSGCDARQETLQRDLDNAILDTDGCTVISGDYYDYFAGEHIYFENDGNGGGVDIDHIVPLGYAAEHGNAMAWSDEKRIEFANTPMNLMAMDAGTNRSKSDSGPAERMPADETYHCEYVTTFIEIAVEYDIDLPDAEYDKQAEVC